MAPKIPTITAKSLQALLRRVGSATSGRKENLISRLSRDLKVPRLPTCISPRKSTRILSIDMGIKNLAFCVADVKVLNSMLEEGGKREEGAETEMNIISWRCLDVVEEVSRSVVKQRMEPELIVNEEELEDPYTPSALSSTAYTLLAQTLLPYKPEIILIERQRWRSSNGVAIQQWTVRVNTLEGMLWAILTTLRSVNKSTNTSFNEDNRDYEIFGVDPKRVGNFWICENTREEILKIAKTGVEDELIVGPEGEVEDIIARKDRPAPKRLNRGKAEKQMKIQLLRSWLTPDARSTLAHSSKKSKEELDELSPAINFTFSPEAEATRLALCSTEKIKGERKSAKAGIQGLKKLDDVTDCFLQAAAWVAWEVNRKKMLHDWDGEQGQLHSVDAERKKKDETIVRGKTKKVTKTRAANVEMPERKDGPKLRKGSSETKIEQKRNKVVKI